MLATEPKPATLTEKDFNPPLKRKEPTIPGYWTIEEIANEIGTSLRKVRYDITGYPAGGIKPSLKAYKAGQLLLVPDSAAFEYIQRPRRKKS